MLSLGIKSKGFDYVKWTMDWVQKIMKLYKTSNLDLKVKIFSMEFSNKFCLDWSFKLKTTFLSNEFGHWVDWWNFISCNMTLLTSKRKDVCIHTKTGRTHRRTWNNVWRKLIKSGINSGAHFRGNSVNISSSWILSFFIKWDPSNTGFYLIFDIS